MFEANASYTLLTPLVPLDRTPSSTGVGRYAGAEPLDASAGELIVSWADGVVFSLMSNDTPNVGRYHFDAKTAQRAVVYDDPDRWELMPRLERKRVEPPTLAPPTSNGTTAVLVGGMNVYTSSLFIFDPASVAA